jgi:3-oxoacyl-[acyl-carrier protein] reductase
MCGVKGKSVIVTGSTRGIGLEIATSLLKRGARVVISGRSQDKIDAVVTELSQFGEVVGFACDVSSFESCQTFINRAIEAYTKIDVLVNNAGITKDNLLLRMKEEDWKEVIDTNLSSIFYMTKSITRHMLKNKSGNIINISSVVGITGNAGQANYAAAKAGIFGFTKTIAKELGSKGILCNAIAPGFIETDMINTLPEDYINNIIQQTAIKRLGRAEDVSNLVVFLASDEASYITGQVISVDGGMI